MLQALKGREKREGNKNGRGGGGEEVRERSACKQQELLQATRALGLGIRVTFPDMIERLVLME